MKRDGEKRLKKIEKMLDVIAKAFVKAVLEEEYDLKRDEKEAADVQNRERVRRLKSAMASLFEARQALASAINQRIRTRKEIEAREALRGPKKDGRQ